jgi:hypothetical protein
MITASEAPYAASALLLAASAVLSLASARRARGRRPSMREQVRQRRFPDGFDGWPLEVRLAYLRHPQHRERCACGRYGMLGEAVQDGDTLHTAVMCWCGAAQ